MNYTNLVSRNLPRQVPSHPGISADTDYVFSVTYTDLDSMPTIELADSLRALMPSEGADLAKYPPPQGHVGLRELIAQRLQENRGIDVPIDSIFLSSGAGGAIGTIVDALIDPGDTVLVEEFTYSGTLNMMLGHRANVVHIPTDEHGMNTDALESTIKDLNSKGIQPKMIYTISVYQNPMGITMSRERKERMVEISQQHGIPIFENESYADFRIDGDPAPPAMMAMDGQNGVMYVSAYTKLLGCGLRLGYGVVPEPLQDTLRQLRFGVSPSHLTAMAVYGYLKDHADEYIPSVADSLKSKRDTMLAALGEHFPPTCKWTQPGGGMMLWGELPDGADTWNALDAAIEAGVKYNPGSMYRADGEGRNKMRLTFSYHNLDQIREGIAILAEVFEKQGLFDGA